MTLKQTDGERLVAVETNLQNLTKTVETLAKDTKNGISDINSKLDRAIPTLVTQAEFQQYKTSQNIQKTLLALLMTIIGILVGHFISGITK